MELHLDLRERGRLLLEAGALLWRVRSVPCEPLPRPCRRHLSIALVEPTLFICGEPVCVSALRSSSIDSGVHSGSEYPIGEAMFPDIADYPAALVDRM